MRYYNKHIGGVFITDHDISFYPIAVPSKTWWMSFLCSCLNVAAQKVWLLHWKMSKRHLGILRFCREIVNTYRMKYSTRKRRTIHSTAEVDFCSGKLNKRNVPGTVGHDEFKHYPLSNSTHQTCLRCGKKSRVQSTNPSPHWLLWKLSQKQINHYLWLTKLVWKGEPQTFLTFAFITIHTHCMFLSCHVRVLEWTHSL